MKKWILAATMVFAMAQANAQLTTPQPSPTQTVKQNFGLSHVELSYSRPAMKGRKIFGDLVPFNAVWRTGANSATTLTFGDDVIIGGTAIKAGKYGLLSIPGNSTWTLIITKQTDVTSPAAYKQDQDVVRVNVTPVKTKTKVESFTIQFANLQSTKCDLQILWDKTVVTLTIETEVDSKVMAKIEELMKGDKPPYFNAAAYYLENGKDLTKALGWFNKALETQPDAFWIHHQKANCLAKLGNKADAIAAANQSKELAAKAGNGDYVKLNEKLLATLK
ncbi:MAG: hypothetical protein RIR12_1780 [Bacteroidota bacterium]|jgi:hypothetical protein